MTALTPQEERYLLALKRRKAALESSLDLLDFARFMRPDPRRADDVSFSQYSVQKHHRAIAAALEQVELGLIPRLIINVPPRHGKSELSSRLFPAWFHGRHPEQSIILATYADKLSWDFGREVRELIEDPLYAQVFPHRELLSASVDRIEGVKGGKLFFVGRGSAISGRGAIGLLIDDPIKDRVEADSVVTRKKLWEWYNQVAKTRLNDAVGWIVIIQTRWHEDDLVGRLTDPTNPDYSPVEGKRWKIIDLPALAKDKDPLGRKYGEALWPAKFPVPYLEGLREADPRGFQALYQGSPTPEKGNFFLADGIRTYSRSERPPNEKLRFYAASDHAVSTKQDRDRTCLLVIGIDEDQNIWVMDDPMWGRYASNVVVERMIDLMVKYKPLMWWAERGHITGSIGPFLRKRMLERNTFSSVFEVTPVHDKQARAQSIKARMAMGMVYFPSYATWWMEARQEILQFPFGTHDDFVDALAWVGVGLVMHAPPKVRRKETPPPATGTLGWIKASQERERKERRSASKQGW
jgi:predicted phage terminase large subunit-like protein